jgi:hypothetical protein
MSRFPCPYLKGEVELTAERELHIAERHPDLLPGHRQRVAETVCDGASLDHHGLHDEEAGRGRS